MLTSKTVVRNSESIGGDYERPERKEGKPAHYIAAHDHRLIIRDDSTRHPRDTHMTTAKQRKKMCMTKWKIFLKRWRNL